MHCSKCGHENASGNRFCIKCGTELMIAAEKQSTLDRLRADLNEKKLPAKLIKPLVAAVLTVLILATVVFVIWKLIGGVPSDKVIKEDVADCIEAYMDFNSGYDIVKISNEKERGSKDKTATVYSTVTASDGETTYEQSYKLSYRRRDSGWKLNDYEAYHSEDWQSYPASGPSEEIIKASFIGISLNLDGTERVIREEDKLEVRISDQNEDLEKGEATVSLVISLSTSVASYSQQAVAEYQHSGGQWKLDMLNFTGEASKSFLSGREFDKDPVDLKAALYQTPIMFEGSHGTQPISVSAECMEAFQFTDHFFDWSSDKTHFTCTFRLMKPVATLAVTADVVYTYGSAGWMVESVEYTPVVETIDLTGSWTGEYPRSGGKPSLTIQVDNYDLNDMFTAVCSFGPSSSVPDYLSSSFSSVGGVQKENLKVSISAENWISDDPGLWYDLIDYTGMLWIDDAVIKDKNGFEVKLS